MGSRVPFEQFAGNIVLFLPLGVGLAMLVPASWARLLLGLSAGALAGVVVEALRWILGAGRISSVDDVILASLGTAVGLCAASPLIRWSSADRRQRGAD